MAVTRGQITKALAAVEGVVSRAAGILGIARKNLYIRMASLEIDPNDFRRNSGGSVTVTAGVTPLDSTVVTGSVRASGSAGSARVFATDTLKRGQGRRKFGNVIEQAVATVAEAEHQKKLLRQGRTLYLRPEQYREVDDACFDLAALFREKQSPSKVVERFMDDCFSAWVSGLKASAKPNGKKR